MNKYAADQKPVAFQHSSSCPNINNYNNNNNNE